MRCFHDVILHAESLPEPQPRRRRNLVDSPGGSTGATIASSYNDDGQSIYHRPVRRGTASRRRKRAGPPSSRPSDNSDQMLSRVFRLPRASGHPRIVTADTEPSIGAREM
jgi:hypothetical protein